MYFKFRPYDDLPALCGVIGTDGWPYWILHDVAVFQQYKEPYKLIKTFLMKYNKELKTVKDVLPITVKSIQFPKRKVIKFWDMINFMNEKNKNFHDINDFLTRFFNASLTIPTPTWKYGSETLNGARELTVDIKSPYLYTGQEGTMKYWLSQFAKSIKTKYDKIEPKHTVYRPVQSKLLNSMTLKELLERHVSPMSTIEDNPGHSVNHDMDDTTLPPPSPLPSIQSIDSTISADFYQVQSPASNKPSIVPNVQFEPISVNEDYLVEAPASVPPSNHRQTQEEEETVLDRVITHESIPFISKRPSSVNLLKSPKKLKMEETSQNDLMDATNECNDYASLMCDSDTVLEEKAVSNKQRFQEPLIARHNILNNPVELPKICINIGEKTFSLRITLNLEEEL